MYIRHNDEERVKFDEEARKHGNAEFYRTLFWIAVFFLVITALSAMFPVRAQTTTTECYQTCGYYGCRMICTSTIYNPPPPDYGGQSQ